MAESVHAHARVSLSGFLLGQGGRRLKGFRLARGLRARYDSPHLGVPGRAEMHDANPLNLTRLTPAEGR
ncbi:hypothetical protein Ga0080574_TMP1584 [Salipiger abyssi]|uniref:Uncharacterized protein n=1 Tax=Salipiger abyssi TaxID=1250539 RepID=A0A1P8URH1_9RHOB|nr:hypothetical protein Ga0080574_TMP1584 [Salipiger abyssi]